MAIFLVAATSVGCGGGVDSFQQPPPPPPSEDFSLSFSPNSLSFAAGTTSAPADISVNALHGFSGNVQITLTGLPNGVTSTPASPFTLASGATQAVVFGAAASAATGSFTLSAQGTSGGLSHSASLSVSVQPAVPPPAIPRTGYARTDSVPSSDSPSGEPRRRRIAYDAGHRRVFVANPAMNRVEVFSAIDQSRVARIPIPGAASVDITPDGSKVWAGTGVEQIASVDTATLSVVARYPVTGIAALPNSSFHLPVEVVALANGKGLVRLQRSDQPMSLLALWDPSSNSFSELNAAGIAPSLFQSGAGVLARSGDHTRVLVAANDASGNVALFDADANLIGSVKTLGNGSIPLAAANADGSRFAVVFVAGGRSQILLLDSALIVVASRATASPHGLTFSRDGNFLYVSENADLPPVITVLAVQDLRLMGQVADVCIEGARSAIEEADETGLLFGMANRGISFVDAASPGALPSAAPVLGAAPALSPAEGSTTGGVATILTGQNFESTTDVRFGSLPAQNVSVTGSTQIHATSPPSGATGSVNVSAYFPSGWIALAPAAFSYGPQILALFPNAGKKSGGDIIQILGHGFGSDAGMISVKIGGAAAVVQKIEDLSALRSSGSVGANYPYPLERITVKTPAGTAGKADIIVTAPSGTTTVAKSFQFLQDVQLYARPGPFKFILHDRGRQRVYLSATDHVDVFDLKTGQWLFPPTQPSGPSGLLPPGGPPGNAGLRGLALTPDGTQLVVADFGAQKVYLLNPNPSAPGAPGSGTTVFVGGVAGFLNSGPARVAVTSTSKVFVGLSGEGASGACSLCLGQLDLTANPPVIQPAPQPELSALTGAPLVEGTADGDQVYLSFGAAPGGPVAVWQSATDHFTLSLANASTSDLGIAADGSMLAVFENGTTQVRGADLMIAAVPAVPELEAVPGRISVPGVTLHPTGALLYRPFLAGAPGGPGTRGGVDISDAHSGTLRMRIFLPEAFSTDVDGLHGSFLAIDETGKKLFAITTSGLTVIELASMPLSIGTLQPAQGPATGGTQITIGGSGFQSGSKVKIGGAAATSTFVDANTLRVTTPAMSAGAKQMVITNPDGESVVLDAAFTAN